MEYITHNLFRSFPALHFNTSVLDSQSFLAIEVRKTTKETYTQIFMQLCLYIYFRVSPKRFLIIILCQQRKKNTLRVMKNLPEQNCKSKSGEGIEGGQTEQRRKETLRLTPRFPVRAAVLLCEETPGSHAI